MIGVAAIAAWKTGSRLLRMSPCGMIIIVAGNFSCGEKKSDLRRTLLIAALSAVALWLIFHLLLFTGNPFFILFR
jgi:hypothetical protein